MALTPTETEAKIAALEDRVSLLFQATDSLESQFEQDEQLWSQWATELREALAVIGRQIERVRLNLPANPQP